jgi:hypothetical protein
MTKNLKKFTAGKKLNFFLSKTSIANEAFSSQERTSSFFLLLWVIFALLDPDPDSKYESGSGSTGQIESGSATLHESVRKLSRVSICEGRRMCRTYTVKKG